MWVNKKFILKKFLVGIFFKIQNSQSHIERIEVFYLAYIARINPPRKCKTGNIKILMGNENPRRKKMGK